MIPGVKQSAMKDVKVDEKQLARQQAIILSMTQEERDNPDILNSARKKRIAAGSGTTVEQINRLLKQFDQMQQMMKKFTGSGSKMNLRKARKQLAGMNFDKLTGKGGGNLPPMF